MKRVLSKLTSSLTGLRLQWSSQRIRPGRQAALRWAGIDLQEKHLHLVVIGAASNGSQIQVLECVSRELEGELSADTLTDIVQSLASRPQRWSLLLPRDDYRLSVIPVPEVPDDELSQSVRWQLAPVLDFPVEDAAVDFMTIPVANSTKGHPSELYAIAARGDTVTRFASLFREARVPLTAIDIHETAQRNLAARIEHPDEVLVMVAFHRQAIQITFSWQGELYLDRLLAEPRNDEDSPARRAMLCERVALQVQRSLDTVRASHPFMQAARIVVAGAPEGFVASMGALAAVPVEVMRPEAFLDLRATPALCDTVEFMRYFQAIGTALRGFTSQESAT